MSRDALSRRGVLRRLGSLAGGFGATRLRRPDDSTDRARVVVGYDSPRARREARAVADRVDHDFAFDATVVTASRDGLHSLAGRSSVRYLEPVRPVVALNRPLNRGVDRVDAVVAQNRGASAAGVDVAVLDTGIDGSHAALRGSLASGKAFVRADLWHRTPWDDDHRHGTHCAGVIGARTDDGATGVSADARLHALKVLDGNGSGTTTDLAAGIEYAADQGWDVVNLSVGTTKSKVVEEAVEYAASEGVLLVGAASRAYRFPASEPECLAVAASDQSDSPATFAPGGGAPDILAPGVAIRSTVPGGFETLSGNSIACAHVSGAAAQLVAEGQTAATVRDTLLETAEDLGLDERTQGAGMLDVAAALGYESTEDVAARNKRRASQSNRD